MLDVRAIREDPDRFRKGLARRNLAEAVDSDPRAGRAPTCAHGSGRGAACGAEPDGQGDRRRPRRREAAPDRRGRPRSRPSSRSSTRSSSRSRPSSPTCWHGPRTCRTRPRRTGSRTRTRSRCAATANPPTFDFEPKDHAVLGEQLGMLDTERAARTSGSRFVYLLGDIVQVQFALVRHALDILTPQRVHPRDPAGARPRGGDVRQRVPPDRRGQHLRHEPGRALPGRHVGGLAGRVPRDRDPGRAGPSGPLRGVLDVLPSRGRHVREGHGRDVPRPPVRQGGDVLVRATRGLLGRARAHGRDRGGDRRQPRPALPRRERGGGRPGGSRREEVRPRGLAAGAGPLPGAHVLLELHRLRGPARADAGSARPRARSRSCTRSTGPRPRWAGP